MDSPVSNEGNKGVFNNRRMIYYLKGLLRNILNSTVSLLAFSDDKLKVTKRGKINRFTKIVNSKIGYYFYVGV